MLQHGVCRSSPPCANFNAASAPCATVRVSGSRQTFLVAYPPTFAGHPSHSSPLFSGFVATSRAITAFYDRQGRVVDMAPGALPDDALRHKLRQLYDVEV